MAYLDRPGCRIYFERTGAGEPVLFIQGVGVAGSGWRPQVDQLSRSYTALIFDNRGIGRSVPSAGPLTVESMAKDAAALIADNGWSSAHVVGHSLGGVVAQQLALDVPGRIKSLALICTFARGKDGARFTPAVAWIGLRTRIGTRSMRRRAFVQLLVPADYLKQVQWQEVAASYAPLIGRDLAVSPPVMQQQLKALGAHDISGRLAELAKIPTMIISGKHDPIALPEYGRKLQSLIPGSEYIEFKDGSHGLTIQHDREVNQILDRFFRKASEANYQR